MPRHPHILNAATNLIGICFLIIGGLKLTNSNGRSFADEIAWLATFLLLTSAILAYASIRNDCVKSWQAEVADWSFLGGLLTLTLSLVVLVVSI